MKPVLDAEGQQVTRRQTCACGHEYQQSEIEVVGETAGGGNVERRQLFVPLACPACSRAKIRVAAHQSDPNVGHAPVEVAK